ncbi:replication protein A1, 70 kDa-like protein [Naegleria gruberi]|uniref:Replication protein A1, 70 kDa-like protein n=1 Tax=Naegleria gruberi TaxID=5762 RepID=D2VPJ6_NAEGR|nr:replication protein A1, 70 kDa-like protein [Naegleria gruberi]EFC41135.1 replication protein A1, 70 kDa-like protein [Naegleria gruberi]|eukprot:XP_002673879.1 replication protein A1, 70 kDa-like protein [Naegleria gruberi strain NEG-M]
MPENLVEIINNANDASQVRMPVLMATLKSPQLISKQPSAKTPGQVLYKVNLYDTSLPTPSSQNTLTAVIPKDRFPSDVSDPETIAPGTIFNISKFTFKAQPGKAKVVILHTFTLESNNNHHHQQSTTSTTHVNEQKPVTNVQPQRSNPTSNPTPSSNVKPPSFSVNNSHSNNTVNNQPQQVNRNNQPQPNTFNRPQPQQTATNSNPVQQRNQQQTFNRPSNPTNNAPRQSVGNVGPLKTKQILPLVGITPWVSDWVIKVRVTKKGELKKWSNPTKEGHLFSLELIDEDGVEIRATFFTNKFYDHIKESKVYFMKGGKAKSADKKYSRLPHSYELTFYDNSVIEEAEDDQAKNIPQGHFEFIPFEQLKTIEKKNGVDIVGVVKSIGNSEQMTIKSKQDPNAIEKQTTKRELILINKDNDGNIYEAAITLWGEDNISFNIGDTVIFTALTIKEFKGGVKLSTSKSTKILTNFDLPESRRVMEQFANLETPIEEIKGVLLSAIESSGSFKKYSLEDLDTVRVQDLEQEKFKSKTFFIRSHFSLFKDGNLTYCACVNEECKSKKLKRDEMDNSYTCPLCNTKYDETTAAHKYMTSVVLGDHTCTKTLTAFDKGMTLLLGVPAGDFYALDDRTKDEYKSIAQSKIATYMVRAGVQNNNEQGPQVRFSFVGLKEPEWAKEAKGCLGTINAYCRTFGI